MYDGYKEPSDDEQEELVNLYEKLTTDKNSPFFDSEQFEQIIEFYLQHLSYSKAEEVIERALNQHPGSSSLKLHRAQLLIVKGIVFEALQIIDEVRELEPYNAEVYIMMGNAFDEMGSYKEALKWYEQALDFEVEKDDVYLYMAYTFQNDDNYADAIEVLKKALLFNPDNSQALSELAFCCDISGNCHESKVFLESLIDEHPYSYMAWYCLGVVQNRMDLVSDALVSFDYASIINPTYLPSYLNLGNLYYNLENYHSAIESFRKYLEHSKEDVTALCFIANCYRLLDNNKLARTYYKKSIEIDAAYYMAWFGIGLSYQAEEAHSLAIDYFKKAIALEPEEAEHWFALAESYSDLDQATLAYEAYDKCIDIDEFNAEYWISFVLFLKDNNMMKEAKQMALIGLEVAEEPVGLNLIMAGFSIKEGQLHEAVFHLVEAREMDEEAREEFEEIFPELKYHYLLDEIFND